MASADSTVDPTLSATSPTSAAETLKAKPIRTAPATRTLRRHGGSWNAIPVPFARPRLIRFGSLVELNCLTFSYYPIFGRIYHRFRGRRILCRPLTLHGLLSRRLLILVENPSGFAKVEGITVAELYERLADDLRLMEDIGWASEADQESVGLTMPREKLAETLKRLRRDARRAPFSVRHEQEPKESVDERWRRFWPTGHP